MNKTAILFLLLFFYYPGKGIQAQEVQPIDLLHIDFWVDGARIDNQTIQTFEKGLSNYSFETEEILLAHLYKEIGDIQQSTVNNNTRHNLNKIIISASKTYGPGSCYEGLARVALGMCDEEFPSKAIPVCQEGITMIESLYGQESREWALAMTFLAYLYLKSDKPALAESGFADAIDGYAAATPYYCMPSIVFLQTRAIDMAEQGHIEQALSCTKAITCLLDLFISNRKKLEDAYIYLPRSLTPVSDYDMVCRTYVNITYIYSILKRYEEALIQADRGMAALENLGFENTYSYALIMNNKAELYLVQQNVSTAWQWFDKARIRLEQIGETRSSLYRQICNHLNKITTTGKS